MPFFNRSVTLSSATRRWKKVRWNSNHRCLDRLWISALHFQHHDSRLNKRWMFSLSCGQTCLFYCSVADMSGPLNPPTGLKFLFFFLIPPFTLEKRPWKISILGWVRLSYPGHSERERRSWAVFNLLIHSICSKRCWTSQLNFRDNVGFVHKQSSSQTPHIITQWQMED